MKKNIEKMPIRINCGCSRMNEDKTWCRICNAPTTGKKICEKCLADLISEYDK